MNGIETGSWIQEPVLIEHGDLLPWHLGEEEEEEEEEEKPFLLPQVLLPPKWLLDLALVEAVVIQLV
jgi:hypothetical protein